MAIQENNNAGDPVSSDLSAKAPKRLALRWRPVDIATASIIAVASGLVFWGVDMVVTAPYTALEALIPGLAGLLNGLWYFPGVLAMLIVRKPGAAVYAEVLAAAIELTLGNQWGAGGSLVAGIFQGVATEIAFLILAYRKWNVWVAALGGAFAAVGGQAYTVITAYAGMTITGVYVVTNTVTNIVSGALLSGVLMWMLFVAIARTGALDRFQSGRTINAVAR